MDYYFDKERAINRLITEHNKHGSLIIALDFDHTVCDWMNEGGTYDEVTSLVAECSEMGWPVILFTAALPERFTDMIEYLKLRGINIASINKNYTEGMTYGNWGKPYWNILLDDRSGLFEAFKILSEALTVIKTTERFRRKLDTTTTIQQLACVVYQRMFLLDFKDPEVMPLEDGGVTLIYGNNNTEMYLDVNIQVNTTIDVRVEKGKGMNYSVPYENENVTIDEVVTYAKQYLAE